MMEVVSGISNVIVVSQISTNIYDLQFMSATLNMFNIASDFTAGSSSYS